VVFVGGHEENYQDSLANTANRVRERVGTCSRTARVRIEQDKGIPPCRSRRRYSSSVGNFSTKDICPSFAIARQCERERAGSSTSRTSSTCVLLRSHRGESSRGASSLLRRQRPGSASNPREDNRSEVVCVHVRALASKVLDVWQAFSSCRRREQEPSTK